MWCSSNHLSTPTCACPSAPPPSSATPTVGRDFVCGLASLDVWAGASGAAAFSSAKRRSADSFAQLITRWQETLTLASCSYARYLIFLSAAALLTFAVVACRTVEGIMARRTAL